MAAILCHPDTVSGTTILEGGARVYWTEKGEAIVKEPGGRVLRVRRSDTCMYSAVLFRELDKVHDRDIGAVRGEMNHLQVQEWHLAVRGKLAPLVPLDSPDLSWIDDNGGPYTDEQFQLGRVKTKDYAKLYGCAYQVERFTGDTSGVMGVSRRLPSVAVEGQPFKFGEIMPRFASRDEAVAYLKEQGFYSRVLAYACDPRFLRGETEERTYVGGEKPRTVPCEPWVYVGVTDVVNIPPEMGQDSIHGHLMEQIEPELHYAPPAPVGDPIPF